MGTGGKIHPADTQQLMKYVDTLVTDRNKSVSLSINTREKNAYIFSKECTNCSVPNPIISNDINPKAYYDQRTVEIMDHCPPQIENKYDVLENAVLNFTTLRGPLKF